MAWPPILVRYGEIGIKSRSVRNQFERKLIDRIEEQLVRRGVEGQVTRDWGRLFLRAADEEKALDALRHTFGIVSASPAVECGPTPDAVAERALEVAREHMPHGATFAMRVKRSGVHTFTSLDVAKAAAARILDELKDREPTVDLDKPAFALHVEVREGGAFVFTRTVHGPGGLPLGSQGRIAILVDSPRAAHAAWLMAKRGSAPFFFSHDEVQAREWLRVLEPWMREPHVRRVEGATRREQYAALAPLMTQHRCQALVVADDAAGALAGADDDRTLGFPVFRPLVGYPGKRFDALDAEVRS